MSLKLQDRVRVVAPGKCDTGCTGTVEWIGGTMVYVRIDRNGEVYAHSNLSDLEPEPRSSELSFSRDLEIAAAKGDSAFIEQLVVEARAAGNMDGAFWKILAYVGAKK
jgi:hypothetical protein